MIVYKNVIYPKGEQYRVCNRLKCMQQYLDIKKEKITIQHVSVMSELSKIYLYHKGKYKNIAIASSQLYLGNIDTLTDIIIEVLERG